jgi:hypothetical protein
MHQPSHPGTLAAGAAAVLAVTFGLAAGTAWAAKPSSFGESRGYQTCVDAAEREVQLVKVASRYFIYDHSDARRYYLNGVAFRDGDATPIKIACDTTSSGHRLLGVSVDAGEYAGRLVEPVDVARN